MRLLTALSLVLTAVAGCLGFQSSGEAAELMKLMYAYFALTTLVCGFIAAATRRHSHEPQRTTVAITAKVSSDSKPLAV